MHDEVVSEGWTYWFVSVEMIEHRVREEGVKRGRREVEIVKDGSSGSEAISGSVWSRKNGLVMPMAQQRGVKAISAARSTYLTMQQQGWDGR